jgi:GTP-binding protein
MKFVDEVSIHVKAGDGGDGAVAWRREKFIPRGGPAGGDGGDGGDIVLEVDPQLSTLLDYRYVREHKARSGEKGQGSDMNGRNGEALVLRVPPGTVVKDAASGEVLVDLAEGRFLLAKGGRGGLGNMNFATSTNQAPRFAEDGTPGEEKDVVLELKLLADVGIVGYPNAGKSTLISRISAAKPKIADYPFTTLTPHLGVVSMSDDRSFVVADVPGLIEGAHRGQGLGHQFLRHIERTKVLVYLVDVSSVSGREPADDLVILRRELELFRAELLERPQLVAANKIDALDDPGRLAQLEAKAAEWRLRVFPISAVTGQGVPSLLEAMWRGMTRTDDESGFGE